MASTNGRYILALLVTILLLMATSSCAAVPSPSPSGEAPDTRATLPVSQEPEASPTPAPTLDPIEYPPLKIGDTISFGTYEQDNDAANGKEPIAWKVIDRTEGKALLFAEMSLDCRQYNPQGGRLTWATTPLRAWLNGEFMAAAFDAQEASAIDTTTVSNPANPDTGVAGDDATMDKLFLLSYQEAQTYFKTDAERTCLNTAYAKAQGANDTGGLSSYWLRSPGISDSTAALVSNSGNFYLGAYWEQDTAAIRPAFWLDLHAAGYQ